MPAAGDWKDMFLACGEEADYSLVKYHLELGRVDPNFQHPEYMTSPLFEAIRFGNADIIDLLMQSGASLMMTEEASGLTPLEVAMEERQHNSVDCLLQYITEDGEHAEYRRKHVKTFLVSGTVPKEMLLELGGFGHFLLVDDACSDAALVEELQRETGNSKIYLANMVARELKSISHWILKEEARLLELVADYAPSMEHLERCILIATQSPVSAECSWLLQHNSRTSAVFDPETTSSWLSDLTSCGMFEFQESKKQKFVECIWWLATTYYPTGGRLFTYKREIVATPYDLSSKSFDDATQDWNDQFPILRTNPSYTGEVF